MAMRGERRPHCSGVIKLISALNLLVPATDNGVNGEEDSGHM